jgi:IS30 family transposase
MAETAKPGDLEMQISHETIYRSLFVQARGVLKKELVGHLRTRRVIRRSLQSRTRGQGRGQIVDADSPTQRPLTQDFRMQGCRSSGPSTGLPKSD